MKSMLHGRKFVQANYSSCTFSTSTLHGFILSTCCSASQTSRGIFRRTARHIVLLHSWMRYVQWLATFLRPTKVPANQRQTSNLWETASWTKLWQPSAQRTIITWHLYKLLPSSILLKWVTEGLIVRIHTSDLQQSIWTQASRISKISELTSFLDGGYIP